MADLTGWYVVLVGFSTLLLCGLILLSLSQYRATLFGYLLATVLAARPWIYLWCADVRLLSFQLDNLIAFACLGWLIVLWLLSPNQRRRSLSESRLFLAGVGLLVGQVVAAWWVGFSINGNWKLATNQALVVGVFLATIGLSRRGQLRVLFAITVGSLLLAGSVIWNVVGGVGLVATVGGLEYHREGGALIDGWNAGPVLMVGAIASLLWLFRVLRFRGRTAAVAIVFVATITLGLVLTGSRASITGLIGFVAAMLLLSPRRQLSLRWRVATVLLFGLMLVVVYRRLDVDGFQRLTQLIDPAYYASSSSQYSTAIGRIDNFKLALETMADRRFFGYGMTEINGGTDSGSSYTWFLYTSGPAGFVLWGMFLLVVAARGIRQARVGDPRLCGVLVAALLCSAGEVIWTDTVRGIYVLSLVAVIYRLKVPLFERSNRRARRVVLAAAIASATRSARRLSDRRPRSSDACCPGEMGCR